MTKRDLDILLRILERRGCFGHREHIELTWSYLGIHDAKVAHRSVAAAIRRVADMHGAPDKYHETITRSWVQLVAVHRASSKSNSFDEFIAENPGLLDRQLLERHYSRDLIASQRARIRWTQPDLRQLPALP